MFLGARSLLHTLASFTSQHESSVVSDNLSQIHILDILGAQGCLICLFCLLSSICFSQRCDLSFEKTTVFNQKFWLVVESLFLQALPTCPGAGPGVGPLARPINPRAHLDRPDMGKY